MNALDVRRGCPASHLDACGPPNCPRCGSLVHVAERSAFNVSGRIRHSWTCDQCGEEFATSISVLPVQV